MDLKVKVLKKFKESIFARFDYRNFKKGKHTEFYYNHTECVLCIEYNFCCKECPFDKFSMEEEMGCIVWIEEGADFYTEIALSTLVCIYEHKDEAVKLLKQFTKKLEKYIEWV